MSKIRFALACCILLALSSWVNAYPKSSFSNGDSFLIVGDAFWVSKNAFVLLNGATSNFTLETIISKNRASGYTYPGSGVFIVVSPNQTTDKHRRTILSFSENRTVSYKKSPLFNTSEINDKTGPQFWIDYVFSNKSSDQNLLEFLTRDPVSAKKPLMSLNGDGTVWMYNDSAKAAGYVSKNVAAGIPRMILQIGTITATQANNNGITGTQNVTIQGGSLIGNANGSPQTYFYNSSGGTRYFTGVFFTAGKHLNFSKYGVAGANPLPVDTSAVISSLDINFSTSNTKTFIINHPTDKKKYLVHAVIESPENRVYYRGKGKLNHGKAVISLPSYFEALTSLEDRTVFLTSIDGNSPLSIQTQDHQKIKNGRFIVISQTPCSDEFNWEVYAVRKDIPPLVVEPEKSKVQVHGMGPYRYLTPQ